ncbi:hypothetical protein L596_003665 [Steinernema carpocapsae]|uniref:DM13 domain-containing protein n=1 Tax=Steinernema carpocapsae TaxID=34508 RepID=A0A4U8UXB1_STECR|nr:hypothetical protein L596_003665 [Steinernema carpocapsae]
MTPFRFVFFVFAFLNIFSSIISVFPVAKAIPHPNYVAPQLNDNQKDGGRVVSWAEYRHRLSEQGYQKRRLSKNEPIDFRSDDMEIKASPVAEKIAKASTFVPYMPLQGQQPFQDRNHFSNTSMPIVIYLPPFQAGKFQKQSKLLSNSRGKNMRPQENSMIGETQRLVHEGYKVKRPPLQRASQPPLSSGNYSTAISHQQTNRPLPPPQLSSIEHSHVGQLQPVTENMLYSTNFRKVASSGPVNGVTDVRVHSPAAAGVPQYTRLAAHAVPTLPLSSEPASNLVNSLFTASSQVRQAPPIFNAHWSRFYRTDQPLTNSQIALSSKWKQWFFLISYRRVGRNLENRKANKYRTAPRSRFGNFSVHGYRGASCEGPSFSVVHFKSNRQVGFKRIRQNGEIVIGSRREGRRTRPEGTELAKDKQATKVRQNSNKLMEWIQQNRPSVLVKDLAENSVISAEQLPYYGSYCGGFSSQQNSTKFNIDGALWAVDDRRFIVSKFHFRPGSMTENITFWAGPKVITEDMIADVFPSENGFYIRPEPINFTVFTVKPVMVRNAPTSKCDYSRVSVFCVWYPKKSSANGKRYGNAGHLNQQPALTAGDLYESGKSSDSLDSMESVNLTIKGGVVTPVENREIDENVEQVNLLSHSEKSVTKSESTIAATMHLSTTLPNIVSPSVSSTAYPTPLEWYEGFQPLLLTLPDDKWIKTTFWMSLRNHKKKSTVAAVLIPNGPGFKIPAPVQLNPLMPNSLSTISSGLIKLIDMKTIEITEFSLTTKGVPSWFMVGKDIGPNSGGHIVPIYEKNTHSFDCESLRDYRNETVTLRLPGTLSMKDVFWFSVYSPSTLVDLAKQYVPYKDINLPPDLHGIATPRCVLP